MDPVHERGSMDLVHVLLGPVHGPGVSCPKFEFRFDKFLDSHQFLDPD